MNVNRFKQLLESRSGNVKPLMYEEVSKITGSGKLKNFISKIKTSDIKIKNWSLNIFKKQNPSQKELLDYIKGPKQTPKNLTPTTPPVVTGQTSGSTQSNTSSTQQTDQQNNSPSVY